MASSKRKKVVLVEEEGPQGDTGHEDFQVNVEVERVWREVRGRLEKVLGTRSELAAALGAYAADHQDHLRPDEVREIRAEYGTSRDPSAEALFPLLLSKEVGGAGVKPQYVV